MVLEAQMALMRKYVGASAITLLLLVLLLFTWNLNMASASSGGVMGGSFFESDSESSSSESYRRDSESEMMMRNRYTPSSDSELAKGSHSGGPMLFFIFIFGMLLVGFCKDNNGNTVSVFKIQVAMLGGGMGSSIQRDLAKIAETADTSSKEGVSNLLTETIQSLDRHYSYCVAGYSCVDLKRSKEDGEKFYNQLSSEERRKFDEETLVNLNATEKRSAGSQKVDVSNNEYSTFDVKESKEKNDKFEEEKFLNGFGDEYIVITVLVAAKGIHKLQNIYGVQDLREALQKLRSLLSGKLLAGEVLWTPQKEDDTLSKGKILEDYPQLAKAMQSFLNKKRE